MKGIGNLILLMKERICNKTTNQAKEEKREQRKREVIEIEITDKRTKRGAY